MIWDLRIEKKAVLLGLMFLSSGCSFQAPHTLVPDYAKKTIRLVALMPVENKSADKVAARMLREKMLDELYYKGYPKIPLEVIDMQLLKLSKGDTNITADKISPRAAGELLKVDAAMYCTLSESETAIHFVYAPTSFSASCELRSAKTEEILWKSRYGGVERNFGYSRYDVERKAVGVYEAAIQEIVNKVVETLPDGPDLTG